MASRRRGYGVGAVQRNQQIQAKFQAKGEELASEQLDRLSKQLEVFTQRLEEFARRHRDEIRKNSQFRRHFQEMCQSVGVDPLASSKGFWAEKLGVGDFYYELAVQIIEVCLSTVGLNGGLMSVDELRNRLMKSRSRTRKEAISQDDVIRAVNKLKSLGHGFKLIELKCGRYLVQSVPRELSRDDTQIWQLAEENNGYVTSELIENKLGWDKIRGSTALERIVKDGMAWIDSQSNDSVTFYWFPALFFEQFNQISGSDSYSGSTSSANF